MKKVKWDVEEMVAIVNLYYIHKNGNMGDLESELKKLSEKFNRRADFLNIHHDEKFRNLNGMKMIYGNIKYVDTDGMNGLSSASQLAYDVVKLYNQNNSFFQKILNEFDLKY